jgi:Zn-dependent protease
VSAWVPTNQFTIGYRPGPTRKLSTSSTELLHLLIAFGVLTLDLALLRTSFSALGGFRPPDPTLIAGGLAFGAVAALTGFVVHEMAHKISAQRHGFWAEFRMSPFGLVLSLFTAAIVGVMFAAPGATVIGGMGDEREWGRTSLAGPLVNLGEGAVFAGLALVGASADWSPPLVVSLLLLAFINAWFATFNLLPFGPLDGQKVLRWNRPIWLVSLAGSATFAIALFLPASAPA